MNPVILRVEHKARSQEAGQRIRQVNRRINLPSWLSYLADQQIIVTDREINVRCQVITALKPNSGATTNVSLIRV